MNQALTALPGVWGKNGQTVHDDLVAVHMHLQLTDGQRVDHPSTSPNTGSTALLAYTACLASGLKWLPTYRGAVLRGMSSTADIVPELRLGSLLSDDAPISGLLLDSVETTPVPGPAYAIWSITGRRVRALQGGENEIVFPPGAKFRVLDVRTLGGNPFVLLRQLPDTRDLAAVSILEDADETALARLEQTLAGITPSDTVTWPERCAGSIRPI
ncbi:hypothetical protein [Streptomyces kaempferi]|uniref:ADP ribosyltransferase domain-containing protein n=1 Tax=Streptomyces kaempferi TaxID=333725 RepID=A0ABW3XPN5_9ACTN